MKEKSPYSSINQLSIKWEKYCHNTTKLLIRSVVNVIGLDIKKSKELIFKGRIQYNPETGQPIKLEDWKRLESAINSYLGIEKDILQKKMIEDSFWLGELINRLDKEQKRNKPLKAFDLSKSDFSIYTDHDKDVMETAEMFGGVFIQNIDDRARAKVQSILLDGIRNNKSRNEVFQDLWEQEEDINRDWDRLIRTETATNVNNGIAMSILRSSSEENIFMKGISAPGACEHCQKLVNNKIVVLKETQTENNETEVDDKIYPIIYPGISNFGRKPKDYIAAMTIHPYCRCTWEEWYLELEKYT